MSESEVSLDELTDRSHFVNDMPPRKRRTYCSRSRKSSCSNVQTQVIKKNRSVSDSKAKVFVFDR